MQELDSGKYFGSEVGSRNIGGIWISLARYDETLRLSPKNPSNGWHVHQNPHFSFILQGGNIERRKNSSDESRPGQICFYHAGEPHQNVNVLYPSKNFNVEIDAGFLSTYDLNEAAVDYSAQANLADMKFMMLRIFKEINEHPASSQTAIHSLVLQTLAKSQTSTRKTPPLWAGKVKQLLRDRWNENLSLQTLSEASGVHPITISKHFPKYFSCTLGEYVRRVRVEKSLAIIKQSNDSLTEIAHNCGFADQSHFTRVFKNLTGLKPGTFRKI